MMRAVAIDSGTKHDVQGFGDRALPIGVDLRKAQVDDRRVDASAVGAPAEAGLCRLEGRRRRRRHVTTSWAQGGGAPPVRL
jgi:hypothetical protein